MIDNDDLLHRVDRTYLGPTGATLPFRIRYSALGLGTGLLLIVFVIARGIVHVPLGFKSLVVILGLTVVITARITKFVTPDRPVRSVVKAAWNDLIAPRPPKHGQTVVVRTSAIPHSSHSASSPTPTSKVTSDDFAA